MQIEKEIERAIRHQAASDTLTTKTKEELDVIAISVKNALDNTQYDFSNASPIVLKKTTSKRFVKSYKDLYSTESVLCQCIKQILDRVFKIKYPNRNKTIKSLFGVLSAVKQMSDFTVVKFDFKDYFNSVSAMYVFKKFLEPNLLDRFEIDLIKDFVSKTKYTYAGFSTSNVMAEIIAKEFDDAIRRTFASRGMLYFERYIDDSVLILNKYVKDDEIKSMLQDALVSVFHDNTIVTDIKCKTKFNTHKFRYVSRRCISSTPETIDYLGYEFWFSRKPKNKIVINYGITEAKRNKYNDRIDKLISCYADPSNVDCNNLELLRHRIAAFTSREVYLSKHFNSNVWKVKGFISNYGELRYLLGTNLIHADTEEFLKKMVEEAFVRSSIPILYFLSGAKSTSGYSLFENMKVNRTIVLVEHIGYDYNSLVKLCNEVGISNIDVTGKHRGYGTLVRDYLIKVKAGY